MVESDSKPVSDEEIEDETDIVDARIEKKKLTRLANPNVDGGQTRIDSSQQWGDKSKVGRSHEKAEKDYRDKDGTGYGDLMTTNVMPYNVNTDTETYVGKPAENKDEEDMKDESQTYIHESSKKGMVDLNKLTQTRVGDHISYYQNGVQDNGVVAKMASSYITVLKEDGSFSDVHINDTFFVDNILVDKTWDEMNMEEKTESLVKIKAYSPRYLTKTWDQLPKELREVLQSDQEHGAYGNIGGRPNVGISTDTPIDADDEYEGNSHDEMQIDNQFQHDVKSPKTAEKAGEFTYSEKPNYKVKNIGVPQQHNLNSWGVKYDKYIKDKEEKE